MASPAEALTADTGFAAASGLRRRSIIERGRRYSPVHQRGETGRCPRYV